MNVSCESIRVSSGWDKAIMDDREGGDEPLASTRSSDFLHDFLTFSQWSMVVFGPIVQPFVGNMPDRQSLRFAAP